MAVGLWRPVFSPQKSHAKRRKDAMQKDAGRKDEKTPGGKTKRRQATRQKTQPAMRKDEISAH